jgi:hypothetical protein
MQTEYYFSSEHGDVPIAVETMARPFMVSPLERHPFLTLGDFLEGVRSFVWSDRGERMAGLLQASGHPPLRPDDIDRLCLTFEKYGTLYHILRLEAHIHGRTFRYAVSVAHSAGAQTILEREFNLVAELHQKFRLPYIPKIHRHAEVAIRGSDHRTESFAITLADWFTHYHEWHFDGDPNQAAGAVIWDMEQGFRALSHDEIGVIISLAAKILTLYFDCPTTRRIHPWHHGAGDFIVCLSGSAIDVRLISVRGYEPLSTSPELPLKTPAALMEGLMAFVLDLSLKMRLDKREGVGETIWAADFIIPFILDGFAKGIKEKEGKGELAGLSSDQVIQDFKRRSQREIRGILAQRISAYHRTDPRDHPVLIRHLTAHCDQVYRLIQQL